MKKKKTNIHKQVRVTKQHINRHRNVKPIHSQMRMGLLLYLQPIDLAYNTYTVKPNERNIYKC